MLTVRDFVRGFRKLDIDRSCPVIVHASLSAFGEVNGGVESVLGALLSSFETIVMPVFTYKTMIIPEIGPPDNAIVYGSGKDSNCMAEIFHPNLPADKMMGVLSETFRTHPDVQRSTHPILSFAGMNAQAILDSQTTHDPLWPIQTLVDQEGWVLLMGVDQTVNTSIHFGEKLAGRKQFIRWALTPKGIISCWGFPGCSQGFEAIAPRLDEVRSMVKVGEAIIQSIPLVNLIDVVCAMLREDPSALLCDRPDCARCNAVRASPPQPKAKKAENSTKQSG
ncbi:MAG TPA: AAC(3) family N-acetyltransferase [Anaerolineales bacterium]|nr:AAC(3) family N-acetyltransferase [Anaerolineales bacterium]